ncbi:MAG: phosphoglucosamine mutase, partial [Planctomycetes bacterium]|nr:phosphoglucosamine mutase [Planctomycetota bacterium]
MSKLMIGISGVRGVVGDNLTPELLVNLGQAFGTWTDSGKVVVGRDTRASGDMVKHAVFSGLLSAGCRIVDVGVCGTPSAAMMISRLGADGGIVISASHNTIEWNALKFFRNDGIYMNEEQCRQLLDSYYGGDSVKVGYDKLHAV